jgi:hypothetical protein
MAFLLYTRRGCHLCEAAEDRLAAWVGAEAVSLIDVDGSAELRRKFGDRVPVLVREVDGETLLEGRFEEADIVRLLGASATAPASSPVDRGRRSGWPPR